MIRIPSKHYKIFAIRFFFLTITLDYWRRDFIKMFKGGKILHILNHSNYDLSAEGFFKKRILLFLYIFQIRIDFTIPWYTKK